MEKDSPSKVSVAELAGRFKGHIMPMPTSNDELPFRRRPPSSLKLKNQKEDNEETCVTQSEKPVVPPNPFKMKMKNSPIIEKLQANLALSPTALLPTAKNPEVKLQPAPLSPVTPCSPLSPSSHQSSEEEEPVGFSSPAEGTPLPSFNKTRARLSFKRRPPTRQHRRSTGEDATLSPCELDKPQENGDEDQVFDSPAEGGERGLSANPEEAEGRDCDNTGGEGAKDDSSGDLQEEPKAEAAPSLETLPEEEQTSECGPAEPADGADVTEEGQEKEEEH